MVEILKFLTYVTVNHGYWATTLVLVLGILPLLAWLYFVLSRTALGKIIDKKFLEKLKEEKSVHREGNRLRKYFSKNVLEILKNIASELDADRVLVLEFSNGTSNLVGLPFLFMSAAAEITAPNVNPVSLQYQRVNTAIAANFLMDLEEKGYIYIEDLEQIKEIYPILYYFMAPNNVKSACFYPLQGIKESIGFIVSTTVHSSGHIIDSNVARPMMARAAQKISSLMSYNELSSTPSILRQKKKWFWIW